MKKYILSLDAQEEIKEQSSFFYNVEEGYLSTHDNITVSNDNGKIDYIFSSHYPTPKGNVSLTSVIGEEDFDKLADCIQGNVLAKTRYSIQAENDDWFVDLLKNEQDEVYFITARKQTRDEEEENIPSVIEKFILKIVEEDDASFTDKRLANESYATKKLGILLREKIPVVKKSRLRKTKS